MGGARRAVGAVSAYGVRAPADMTSDSDRSPAAVDELLTRLLASEDDALLASTRATVVAGLPAISVTPLEGKLLHLLARAIAARRILELGTLAGYSTIWLARALPEDGRVEAIERDPAFATVARRNIARAKVSDRVCVHVGDALEVTAALEGPFDVAFIDADKATLPQQLDTVLPMVRTGGLVICDNVVRDGAVADHAGGDSSARRGSAVRSKCSLMIIALTPPPSRRSVRNRATGSP